MLRTRVVFVNAHHVCELVPIYQNCILRNKRPPLDKHINKLLSLQKNTMHLNLRFLKQGSASGLKLALVKPALLHTHERKMNKTKQTIKNYNKN